MALHDGAPHHAVSFRVRYAETDQMGFVYHANYLVWCEIGRTDYIRCLGTSYAALERDGLLLAVADAQLRFLAPARYDDIVRVVTRVARVQSRAITFAYEVARVEPAPERRLVLATTKLVAMGTNGAARAMPPELAACFRAELAAAERPSV